MTVRYIIFNFYCSDSLISFLFLLLCQSDVCYFFLQWQSDIFSISMAMTVRYILYWIVMIVRYMVYLYCNNSQIYTIFVLSWQSDIFSIGIVMKVRYMLFLHC